MHRGHYAINYESYQLFRESLRQDYSRIFEDSFSPRKFVIVLSRSEIGLSQEEILAPYIELDLRYNIDLLIVLTKFSKNWYQNDRLEGRSPSRAAPRKLGRYIVCQ